MGALRGGNAKKTIATDNFLENTGKIFGIVFCLYLYAQLLINCWEKQLPMVGARPSVRFHYFDPPPVLVECGLT